MFFPATFFFFLSATVGDISSPSPIYSLLLAVSSSSSKRLLETEPLLLAISLFDGPLRERERQKGIKTAAFTGDISLTNRTAIQNFRIFMSTWPCFKSCFKEQPKALPSALNFFKMLTRLSLDGFWRLCYFGLASIGNLLFRPIVGSSRNS